MPKDVLTTPSAPKALGPYSFAVEAGGPLVFLSGQVGLDPQTGDRAEGVEAQTHQIMKNIGVLLGDIGLGHDDIVKTTVFLADMADYPVVNDAYGSYFEDDAPARSAVQVAALPGGFQVEIEVVASR